MHSLPPLEDSEINCPFQQYYFAFQEKYPKTYFSLQHKHEVKEEKVHISFS